jgi:ribosomal-protein-alanine N-acetyltransferase
MFERRAMTMADLGTVLEVESRAYGFPWTRGNFVDSLAAGYLAEVLLAGRERTLIGYFVALTGFDELHLLNVTVAPPWQGQGHGHALLNAVAEHGRRRGLTTLWLEVRAGNVRARTLYRELGFVEAGLRRGYYPATAGRREDAVVMSLALHGGGADAVV